MARPAGLSSDEDFSDDGLSFGDSPPVRRRQNNAEQKGALQDLFRSPKIEQVEDLRLINAVLDNKMEEVRRLVIEEAVDPNFRPRDSPCWTAVHHACFLARVDILRFFLDEGRADPNIHSELFVPLMAVADSIIEDENLLMECFEMLIAKGAKVDNTDWCRRNPLCYAAKRGHYRMVERLLELCPKLVTITDGEGRTALFYAVEMGEKEMVRLLKDAGSDLAIVDRQGINPYDLAHGKDKKEIQAMISTYERPPDLEDVMQNDPTMSNYAYVLTELPDKKRGRFFGFPSDVLKIVHGIGMAYLLKMFAQKQVQLGELLTYGDDEWRQLGISMSFDRRKLMYSVRKFHERYWGKLSLGPQTTVEKDNLSLFNAAKFLANTTRQMHVIASSTYYWNKFRNPEWVAKDIRIYVAKGLGHLYVLEQEMEAIRKIVEEIEREQNIVPADLIRPQCERGDTNRGLKFITVALGAFAVYTLFKYSSKVLTLHLTN